MNRRLFVLGLSMSALPQERAQLPWASSSEKDAPTLKVSSSINAQGKLKKASGLLIDFKSEFFEQARQKLGNADDYSDVRLRIDGKEYKFTLEEFLALLKIQQQ